VPDTPFIFSSFEPAAQGEGDWDCRDAPLIPAVGSIPTHWRVQVPPGGSAEPAGVAAPSAGRYSPAHPDQRRETGRVTARRDGQRVAVRPPREKGRGERRSARRDGPERRAPGYISCNKIAKILGVDSHKPPTWVDLGILKGEPIPYDYGTLKRRVKIEDFKRWLIKPTSWVYFDVKRIRIKSFRRLVELAQQRWGDEWWTTRQAADYLGTTTNLVLQQIKRGRINGFQAIGLDRIRNPRWAFWFVRRSEILKYRMPNRSDSNNFTPSADEFMLKARIEWGLSPAVIAKMMKRDKRSVENRIRFLCRQRGIVVKKLTGKTERAEKKHTCKVCGAVFKSRGRYAFYCTNCRLEKRKNREACKS
jgi:hypothetical protein